MVVDVAFPFHTLIEELSCVRKGFDFDQFCLASYKQKDFINISCVHSWLYCRIIGENVFLDGTCNIQKVLGQGSFPYYILPAGLIYHRLHV